MESCFQTLHHRLLAFCLYIYLLPNITHNKSLDLIHTLCDYTFKFPTSRCVCSLTNMYWVSGCGYERCVRKSSSPGQVPSLLLTFGAALSQIRKCFLPCKEKWLGVGVRERQWVCWPTEVRVCVLCPVLVHLLLSVPEVVMICFYGFGVCIHCVQISYWYTQHIYPYCFLHLHVCS